MTTDSTEKVLVLYRLENAREKLDAAKDLLDNKHYKDSVSRSYYAIFTAARALLATKKLDSAKHSGVISLFNQHFVKNGLICKEASKWLERAKLYLNKRITVIFTSYHVRKRKRRLNPPCSLLKK